MYSSPVSISVFLMKVSSSIMSALLGGTLLLSSVPALAQETASDIERCTRVTGRELQRCISVNNRHRIRLRAATLATKTRAQLRREERLQIRQKLPSANILDRVKGLGLDQVRKQNVAQGSARRRLQHAITTAQDKCNGLTTMRRAACMREAFRTTGAE